MINSNAEYLKTNVDCFLKRCPDAKTAVTNALQILEKSSIKISSVGNHLEMREGERLLDSTAPDFHAEIRKRAKPARVFLVEGLGLGANLQKIAAYTFVTNPEVVVVEPNLERFLKWCETDDHSKLIQNPHYHWLVGLSAEGCFGKFGEIFYNPYMTFRLDNHQFISHPVLSELYSDYFERVWDEFSTTCIQASSLFGTVEDSMVGVQNTFENVDFIESSPGILNLKNQFKDIPAVVVATGPSLSKSIEELKSIQNRALILAADASLSILLDHGITPHFVLSLERDSYSKPFFEKASASHPEMKTQLICYPLVPREVHDTFKGKKWVLYRNYGWFGYFEQQLPKGTLASYQSVTHLASIVAEYLGCSEVVLVGQDLAFDPQNFSSHATGVAYTEWNQAKSEEVLREEIEKRGEGKLIWVPGNIQDKVPTSSVYYLFAKQFTLLSQALKIPLINATEGGVKIPLLAWRSLTNLKQEWPIVKDLFERIDGLRKRDSKKLDLSSEYQYLCDLRDRISTLRENFTMIMENPDVSREKKFEILKTIRESRVQMSNDTRFARWIIQNAGVEIVQLENGIFAQFDDDIASMEKQRQLMVNWINHILHIIVRLVGMFEVTLRPQNSIHHNETTQRA